jgi:hypothetical protein
MASTSAYLPPSVVEGLDRIAAERGVSRNRVILEACERYLEEHGGEWPAGFFHADLSAEDLAELRAGGRELEDAIYAARRDRPVPSL